MRISDCGLAEDESRAVRNPYLLLIRNPKSAFRNRVGHS